MKKLINLCRSAVCAAALALTACNKAPTQNTAETASGAPNVPAAEAPSLVWIDHFDTGLAKAKAENKLALVNFTGSDWCSVCITLKKEVFSRKEFSDYVKDRMVLVEVDYPQIKQLPPEKREKHARLQEIYKIEGRIPTVLVLNGDGVELGRLGYTQGGLPSFLAELEKIRKQPAVL